MISIAMATYNGEKFIEKQLKSILDQTLKVDEMVICDDCSSDNTVEIIKNFIEVNNISNWKLIVNDKSLGCSRNFFKAVKQCKGDLIFLADQDDIWENDKIEIMTNIMNERQDIYALNCMNSFIDDNDNFMDIPQDRSGNILKSSLYNKPKNKKMYFWRGCCMVFRRGLNSYIESVYDVEAHLAYYDAYVSITAMALDGFYILDSNLIRYRLHGNNTCGTIPCLEEDKMSLFERIVSMMRGVYSRFSSVEIDRNAYFNMLNILSEYHELDLSELKRFYAYHDDRYNYMSEMKISNIFKYIKPLGKVVIGDTLWILRAKRRNKSVK